MSDQGSILKALLAIQREVPTLQKSAINPHFKSKYVPLDELHEAVLPIVHKHDCVWTTLPGSLDEIPVLHYRLVHVTSGEAIEGSMRLLCKLEPQGQGSAITYARRYSLMAVLGLVADVDADGAGGGALSQEDLASLVSAAKGLPAAQIKLAFAAAGLNTPDTVDGNVFQRVPRAKAAELCLALSQAEREPAS